MATGDVSKALLALVRSRAGEWSTNSLSDASIYDQLRRGQLELCDRLMEGLLTELLTTASGSLTASRVALPVSGFWRPREVTFATKVARATTIEGKPLIVQEASVEYPFYYLMGGYLYGLGCSATAAYTLTYLAQPTAISSSVDPVLAVPLHDLMVDFAIVECMKMRQRWAEARELEKDWLARIAMENSRFGGPLPQSGPAGDPGG